MMERNVSVDILKVIGILCIILAHINPPSILFQLRNFDVPLLVMISALLGAKTYNKNKGTIKYIIKRAVRLILPIWIFLTIFFGLLLILNLFGYNFNILASNTILRSYLLLDGIGYVWVIRVYFLCSLSLSLLFYLEEKFKKKYVFIVYIFIYILYEIIYYFMGDCNAILQYFVYYLIPYGLIVTFIGSKLENMDNKKVIKFSIFFIIIFVLLAISLGIINNKIVPTQQYKYPPRLYYLSYAIGISMLLYYLIDRKNIINVKQKLNNKVILFIASHSMWIYLWHIPFVIMLKRFNSVNWIFKYITTLIGAIVLTYIQSKIIEKLNIKNKTVLSIFNS